VEPEAEQLMVPAAEHTEKEVRPSAASADSSALEPSGKLLSEALNTQVEAATLHYIPEVRRHTLDRALRHRHQGQVPQYSLRD
jgi:HEAT repeat protein